MLLITKKSYISFVRYAFAISLVIFLLASIRVQAQQIEWAKKVISFSSERTDPMNQGPQYRAIQILGKPNVLPQKNESICAWSPSGADTFAEEYIKVGFENPKKIKQISIAENFNAGSITQIFAYDSTDHEYLLYENKDDVINEKGRMWNVIFQETAYDVYAIKLIIAPAKVKGYNQIDAIGISDSALPYEATINVAPNMPKTLVKESIGLGVNSKAREVAPIITPDGKSLYFTREGHPDNIGSDKKQDVWVSKMKTDGTWNNAENIGSPINTPQHNAVSTISVDGKNLFLVNIYMPDGNFKSGLSKSKKTKNGWEFPKEIKINDYYNKNSYNEFSLAANGKVLLMACQRNDSKGNKDLYVSFLKNGGMWTKPINLGSTINTAEDESTPFIAADSKTIYFSTKGFAGYGDSDIFMSRRLDSTWTKWGEPENLGNLINTPKWDGYFTIPASGEYAYLSSEENAIGQEDIFRIKLFPSIKPEPVAIITGTVLNALDKKPLQAEITMELLNDSTSNEKTMAEFDPETGEFKMVVPIKKTYSLSASKKGFISISENIDLSKEVRFREIRKNINLIPVKEGQTMVLNNLFFNQSKYDILPASHSELNRIIELMKEYPSMEVIIDGHTDGADDNLLLNVKLSQDRANEVKKYLIEIGGIDEKRIQTKGWGQTKPIASNATEESRKKNRRVEFTISKL